MTSASALRAQTYEPAPAVAQVDTTARHYGSNSDRTRYVTPNTTDPTQAAPDTITPDTTVQLRLHQIRLRQTLRIQLRLPRYVTPDTTDPTPADTLHTLRINAASIHDTTDPTQTAGHYRARYDTPDTTEPGTGGISGRATVLDPAIGVAGGWKVTLLGEGSFAD